MYFERFERPTNHYDKRIHKLDEEICALIEKRKRDADDNPGFPTEDLINVWANKYGFQEEFLNGLFGHLFAEEIYKAMIEPKGFVKNIPVLQSFEREDLLFIVPFIKQYENASVVHLTINREIYDRNSSEQFERFEHHFFEQSFTLAIHDINGIKYTCQQIGGGGSDGHMAVQYVVTPPLPENLSSIQLIFEEENQRTKEHTKKAFSFQL